MKWKIKEHFYQDGASIITIQTSPPPNEGDFKRHEKFAWLPKKIGGYRIWMEEYYDVLVYTHKRGATYPYQPAFRGEWEYVGRELR